MSTVTKEQVENFIHIHSEHGNTGGAVKGLSFPLSGVAKLAGFNLEDLGEMIVTESGSGYAWLLPFGTLTYESRHLFLKPVVYAYTGLPNSVHPATSHGFGIIEHGKKYRVIQQVQNKPEKNGLDLQLFMEHDIIIWVNPADFIFTQEGY